MRRPPPLRSIETPTRFTGIRTLTTQGTDDKALRFNEGKPRMELLPFWLLKDLAVHYAKGAEKYEDWNWVKGGNTDTCFGALLRHIERWQSGEDIDEQTNTHHMLAVAWNALAILHGYKTGVDNDKRPQLPKILR